MVERAIRSVRAQRRPPAEVIVVDDSSGDDTGARAVNLGARLITHERNLGRGASRNTGLRAATYDWVALLDCDDEWLPTHLDTLWASRDGHLLVGTAALVTWDGAEDTRTYGWAGRRPRTLRGPADIAVPENKLVTSATMLRRRVALDAGGFRTDMPRAEDLDLWIRILERGSALTIPRVTALYHRHADQVSIDAAQMWAAHMAVLGGHAPRMRSVRRRAEGVLAWDAARAGLADGASPGRSAIHLLRQLAMPHRAVGVAQLLVSRHRAHRLAARFTPSGDPSVAILPGTVLQGSDLKHAVDLRGRSFAGALLYLLRRPTARALVRGQADALAMRVIGIEPIRTLRAEVERHA
jgi:hypothetical protein